MEKYRIFTSKQYRAVVDDMKKTNILGMNCIENKDIFMLMVALGLEKPTQLKNREAMINNTALGTSDKALIASVLLGTATDDVQLDEFADLGKSEDLCEQCAETGYQVLQKKYNDANCDSDLLERRMLNELKFLFTKNVEADI